MGLNTFNEAMFFRAPPFFAFYLFIPPCESRLFIENRWWVSQGHGGHFIHPGKPWESTLVLPPSMSSTKLHSCPLQGIWRTASGGTLGPNLRPPLPASQSPQGSWHKNTFLVWSCSATASPLKTHRPASVLRSTRSAGQSITDSPGIPWCPLDRTLLYHHVLKSTLGSVTVSPLKAHRLASVLHCTRCALQSMTDSPGTPLCPVDHILLHHHDLKSALGLGTASNFKTQVIPQPH